MKNYDPPIKIKDPHLRKMALNAQRMTRSRASPEFARAATQDWQSKGRQDFARAAIAGKAKTDLERAAKLDPAKEEAIARAIAKDKEQQREREERNEGRKREC